MRKARITATVAGLLGMLALFLTVAELVVFSDRHFEREYTKYNVAENIGMSLDDLMDVTGEMMDYLKRERADLVIETTVNGEEREFFNDREKAHMVDVERMIHSLRGVRNMAVAAFLILFLTAKNMWFPGKVAGQGKRICLWGLRLGACIFLGAGAAAAGLLASNFNKYFLWFHQTFFDNDLWLLNPETDLLINIVPEGYFRDTALWIVGLFLVAAVALIVLVSLYLHRSGKKA